jgi:Tol biopolymer transport system component
VCDADGSNKKQITTTGQNTFAAWSTDGNSILFKHVVSPANAPIFRIDVRNDGGSNMRPIDVLRAETFIECGRHVWLEK